MENIYIFLGYSFTYHKQEIACFQEITMEGEMCGNVGKLLARTNGAADLDSMEHEVTV